MFKTRTKSVILWVILTFNLLHHITNGHVQDFIDMLSSNSFVPLINKPTRITPGSATLIDNILTSVLSDHRTGILTTDISDHFPIFAIVDLYTTKKNNLM